MTDEAYEQLKSSGMLPTPSGAALEIMRTANDPQATIDDLIEMVESDPATAARLLKYVNSPIAGVSRQIASLRMAVTLLGRNTVKCIALGFSLVSAGTSQCPGFDDRTFWVGSVARAAASRHIASRANGGRADELFTCGLLSSIGCLAFACGYPETYAEVLRSVDPDDSVLLAATEREAFDIDHNNLSADMMRDWNLPSPFCEAVRFQDDPGAWRDHMDPAAFDIAQVIRLAGWTAALLTPRHIQRDTLTRFVNGASRRGITPDVLDDVFESIKEEWREISPVFGVRAPTVPTLAERYVQAADL